MQDALRDLYQEVILDHGRHPRNHRHPPDANREGRGYNPLCGAQVTIYLETDTEGRIPDVAFEGRGCAISIASDSLMTAGLRGKTEAGGSRPVPAFPTLSPTNALALDHGPGL